MTETKRVRIAASSLVIAAVFEGVKLLLSISDQFHNILWGLQLILILVSLGISAKIAGAISMPQKLRNQSKIILILAGLLGTYAFII